MIRSFTRNRPAARPDRTHLRLQLVNAADWAITSARRASITGMPAHVRVDDVLQRMRDDFGIAAIPRQSAAEVLRERFELRVGALGLTTDAYDYAEA
jgi:hypothetical protein